MRVYGIEVGEPSDYGHPDKFRSLLRMHRKLNPIRFLVRSQDFSEVKEQAEKFGCELNVESRSGELVSVRVVANEMVG